MLHTREWSQDPALLDRIVFWSQYDNSSPNTPLRSALP